MIGDRRHLVLFQNPGPPAADGLGGYVQTWVDLAPAAWHVSIEQATASDVERVASGTLISTQSHLVGGRFHPGVTNQTRMVFGGRTFNVTGRRNVDERGIDMELIAVEVVP